jgi:ABC-type uncharacterized transport system YnjBCD ATPase subunit
LSTNRSDVLAVNFTCATTVDVGDVVEVSADNTVAVPSGAGSIKIVGTVCKHLADATECTVETRFREKRTDRVSGAACAVGAFVFDGDGKVIAYAAETHSAAAIRGVAITHTSNADEAIETLEL